MEDKDWSGAINDAARNDDAVGCTKKAMLEQLKDGEWVSVGRHPTPEQMKQMIETGELPPIEELPVMEFSCKHVAADAFAKLYGELCAAHLIGQKLPDNLTEPPPLSDFRIREID